MNEDYSALKELALDLHWTWNHSTDKIWEQLNADLWNATHNPWVILQTISKEKLALCLSDPLFKQRLGALLSQKQDREKKVSWFQQKYPGQQIRIAYFSMEFMLSEALPIYSGGLGNVAGDQLKAASDLGVPVIGVGLLYSQGYFRQIIDKNGNQQAFYPYNDPGQLPIAPLRHANGEWLRLNIHLPGWSLWLRAWEVKIGGVRLYLLDSNDPANFPAHRGITSELYGGNEELRLKQELILGIGGWRLLQILGLKPEVCHLNEGHAAFAILERARGFMEETGLPFEEALTATRSGNVFTTHTAVPAGFDRFPPALLKVYLGPYAETQLKIPFDSLLKLGQKNPQDRTDLFNMAYLAIRGSGAVNAVSSIHQKVSKHIFRGLFPRWPEEEVPIGSVTNGVHMSGWDSPDADELWTRHCGKTRWLEVSEKLENKIKNASDKDIWEMREKSRQALIDFARNQLVFQLKARGGSQDEIERSRFYLNPKTLTLGFARRFASYKRPNLLLYDPERLIRIMTHIQHPVQIILAGKAHPADEEGQKLIHSWMQFIFDHKEIRSHVIFLSDYDMHLTEHLVQGADVWVNTPRRPWEACGTSGMKILVNGGLNLSELDGWWAEAYTPEVGWALGDSDDHSADPRWDAIEANQLYEILERQIVPEFYNRNAEGIPVAWIAKVRNSMSRLTPQYSANRSVREYTEKYYMEASRKYLKRTANQAALAREIVEWKLLIEQNWEKVRFKAVNMEIDILTIEVLLGNLRPEDVKVELFANGNPPTVQVMEFVRSANGSYLYQLKVNAKANMEVMTPRIVPYHPEALVPLEAEAVVWQK